MSVQRPKPRKPRSKQETLLWVAPNSEATHRHPKGVLLVVHRLAHSVWMHQGLEAPWCTKTSYRHRRLQHRSGRTHRQHETEVDAEAGMLSGVSRKRSIRSSPCWFTEFCKSQCLSHFAAHIDCHSAVHQGVSGIHDFNQKII